MCLAKQHNTMIWPGLKLGPLDPESSSLTTRPLRLPQRNRVVNESDKLSIPVLRAGKVIK